jgi:hypothetical protein
MLNSVFGDSKIGLKWITERAWELFRKLKITMSEAFKKAWTEVRQMFNNNLYMNLKLFVQGKSIIITTTLQDALADSLECIGEMADNKKLLYNISKRIYADYDAFTGMFSNRSTFTFASNIYIKEI